MKIYIPSKFVTTPFLLFFLLLGHSQETNDVKESDFTYDWAGDGFSITAGVGTTLGEQADFFGLTYSAGLGYFHNLGNNFLIGATTEYQRFAGKELDGGFKTNGESFIPILITLAYLMTESFGLQSSLGYSFSAGDGGEGGLTYGFGPFWKPLEAVILVLAYRNIAFGEGSLGALILNARFSLSKK
ncbi:hypothetical protein [Flagellimonas sp.]|uniref:hypothetical protein n=1 Tax=Flagellimonas sp. TaxID=2058762 RepID=UPI003B5106C1